MLKNVLLAALCLPLWVQAQEHNFEIQGTVQRYNPGAKVFLAYSAPGKMVLDSCAIVDGKFHFQGAIAGNKRAFLQMLHEDKGTRMPQEISDATAVFLDEGIAVVTTEDSLKNASVGGTPFNKLDQELRQTLAPFKQVEAQMEADFAKAKSDNDNAKQQEIQQAYFAMDATRKATIDGFINNHADSYVAFMALRSYVDPAADADRAIALFDKLSEPLRMSAEGRIYDGNLASARRLSIGAMAPEITLPDTADNTVALSDFKGKYVLIDFWASWCGPCRRENPNVVKAFNAYKDKNFTILGVSLDGGNQAKEKWLQAIAADQLQWTQISDLKGWQSTAATLYNVRSIPANFLIDPTGKIIAKNLRGEELEATLAEILN